MRRARSEATERYSAARAAKLDEVSRRQREAVLALGFDADFLDAMIMQQTATGYEKVMPFGRLAALVLEIGSFTTVRKGVTADQRHLGLTFKAPGSPTTYLLFRKDEDELYLAGFGEGEPADLPNGIATRLAYEEMGKLLRAVEVRFAGPAVLDQGPTPMPTPVTDDMLPFECSVTAREQRDGARFTPVALSAIAQRLQRCVGVLPGAERGQSVSVRLNVDRQGVIRQAEPVSVSPAPEAQTFAARMRRELLGPGCSPLPVPTNLEGLTFSFVLPVKSN